MFIESYGYLQRICILGILYSTAYCTDLKWFIKKKTIVYGDKATLTCQAQACLPNSVKKWIGGQRYDLLCFNHNSTNPSKYQMNYNSSNSPDFDLMIKNFSFSDANCEYTCACGFLQYTNMLKPEDILFVYPPIVNYHSSEYTENTLNISISMTVSPKPTCWITQKDSSVEVNTISMFKYTQEGFKLYTARIQRIVEFGKNEDWPYFNITCEVGTLNYTLLSLQNNLSKDKSHGTRDVGLVVGIVCGIVVALSTTMIALYIRCFRKKNIFLLVPKRED